MKRAIAVTELMIILLAITAGIALLFIGKQGAEKSACMRDVDLCRNSYALFRGVVKAAIAPRVDCVAVSPPNCGKKIEVSGSAEEKKQRTMHVIAENLRWCWYKTLGNDNHIGEDYGNAWYRVAFLGDAPDVDFCLVCSEFVMPDDVSISSTEWNEYLKKTIPGKSDSYDSFIKIDQGRFRLWKNGWGKDFDYRSVGFQPKTTYAVVSVSAEEIADTALGLYISEKLDCGKEDPVIYRKT